MKHVFPILILAAMAWHCTPARELAYQRGAQPEAETTSPAATPQAQVSHNTISGVPPEAEAIEPAPAPAPELAQVSHFDEPEPAPAPDRVERTVPDAPEFESTETESPNPGVTVAEAPAKPNDLEAQWQALLKRRRAEANGKQVAVTERRTVPSPAPASDVESLVIIVTENGQIPDEPVAQAQWQQALAQMRSGQPLKFEVVETITTSAEVGQASAAEFGNDLDFEADIDPPSTDDPNEVLMAMMEAEAEEKSPAPAPTARSGNPNPQDPLAVTTIALGVDLSIVLDESVLLEWEKSLPALDRGEKPSTLVPTWLMQGLEWLTHTPPEEPQRSQRLMPLVRHMQDSGMLNDVDVKRMSPAQVVRKIRLLVSDLKTLNGPFANE